MTISEGWQLVPKEPTVRMVDAAFVQRGHEYTDNEFRRSMKEIWTDMLAAAPQPTPPQPMERQKLINALGKYDRCVSRIAQDHRALDHEQAGLGYGWTFGELRQIVEAARSSLSSDRSAVDVERITLSAKDFDALQECLNKPAEPKPELISLLSKAQETVDLNRLRSDLTYRLNEHLSEMRPGHDDSIVGFNAAWDVVTKFFDDRSNPQALNTGKGE